MYCILNVHHDTGADDKDVKHWIKADEANYKENKEKFEYLWTQIATRSRTTTIIWCSKVTTRCLMPTTPGMRRKPSSYKGLNRYAQSFVNAVRATSGSTRNTDTSSSIPMLQLMKTTY